MTYYIYQYLINKSSISSLSNPRESNVPFCFNIFILFILIFISFYFYFNVFYFTFALAVPLGKSTTATIFTFESSRNALAVPIFSGVKTMAYTLLSSASSQTFFHQLLLYLLNKYNRLSTIINIFEYFKFCYHLFLNLFFKNL